MNAVDTINCRILVINDDSDSLEIFKNIFHGQNFSDEGPSDNTRSALSPHLPYFTKEPLDLDCVEKGLTGLEYIRQAMQNSSPYSIVFLVFRFQHAWDEIETVRKILTVDPHIQIVVCADNQDIRWSDVLPLKRYRDQVVLLPKPVNPIQVRELSASLIMKWHWTEQVRLQANEMKRVVKNPTIQAEGLACGFEENVLREQEIKEKLVQAQRDLQERNRDLAAVREQALIAFHERERIDLILRTQTEELARSNRELEQFASVAAHDLQEPLHSIQVFLDLFLVKYGSTFDKAGKGYLNRVTRAAGRMQQLIQDLLTYSRIHSPIVASESIELNQLVEDILSDLEARIQESQAVIEVDQLPRIKVPIRSVTQILHNLMSNALKFHKAGVPPKVKISGTLLQDRRQVDSGTPGLLCQIDIQDRGIGIPQEQIQKVFGMFKRLHQQDEYEGTGIGLAICQRIISRLGGTIVVQSRLGEGANFRVTFPIPA